MPKLIPGRSYAIHVSTARKIVKVLVIHDGDEKINLENHVRTLIDPAYGRIYDMRIVESWPIGGKPCWK